MTKVISLSEARNRAAEDAHVDGYSQHVDAAVQVTNNLVSDLAAVGYGSAVTEDLMRVVYHLVKGAITKDTKYATRCRREIELLNALIAMYSVGEDDGDVGSRG